MKKTAIILSIISIFISCDKQKTIQTYIVENQDKPGFMSVDLPMSLIQLNREKVPNDVKDAYESIKKVNVLGLPYLNNSKEYEIENLQAGLSYIFQILAQNGSNKTPYSEPLVSKVHTPRTTFSDTPPTPFDVKAESNSGEALISWEYPEDLNGASFSIQYYEPDSLKNTSLNNRSDATREGGLRGGESNYERLIIGGEKAEIEDNWRLYSQNLDDGGALPTEFIFEYTFNFVQISLVNILRLFFVELSLFVLLIETGSCLMIVVELHLLLVEQERYWTKCLLQSI